MGVSAGSIDYSISGFDQVSGQGIVWTADELTSALENEIVQMIFDDEGISALRELLNDLIGTGFDEGAIEKILSAPPKNLEDWRVGEAIAEAYIQHHRSCFFPWPDSRDQRKSGSSLPGADLIGFIKTGQTDLFVFGEVKTSAQKLYPPKVVSSRHGLQYQLEELRDDKRTRAELVKYLGHRALGTSWRDNYISAFAQFVKSDTNVKVFGVLIRDVMPNQKDLEVRVSNLDNGCSADMNIELIALYLPDTSIASLNSRVLSLRSGGESER